MTVNVNAELREQEAADRRCWKGTGEVGALLPVFFLVSLRSLSPLCAPARVQGGLVPMKSHVCKNSDKHARRCFHSQLSQVRNTNPFSPKGSWGDGPYCIHRKEKRAVTVCVPHTFALYSVFMARSCTI